MDNHDQQLDLVDSIVALKKQLECCRNPKPTSRGGMVWQNTMRQTAIQSCKSIIADCDMGLKLDPGSTYFADTKKKAELTLVEIGAIKKGRKKSS